MDTKRVLAEMWDELARLPKEKCIVVVDDLMNARLMFQGTHPETAEVFLAAFDSAYNKIHGE